MSRREVPESMKKYLDKNNTFDYDKWSNDLFERQLTDAKKHKIPSDYAAEEPEWSHKKAENFNKFPPTADDRFRMLTQSDGDTKRPENTLIEKDENVEHQIQKIVESGKEGLNYEIIDRGKQEVDTDAIDTPDLRPEDFQKRSSHEMEEYILQDGLEKSDTYQPVKLLQLGDRYCVGSDGRHRVFLAKHERLETIPARVKEIKKLQ